MRNFLSKKKGNYPLNSKTRDTKHPFVWILVAFLMLVSGKEIIGAVSSVVFTPFYLVHHYIETSSATVPTFFRERAQLLSQIEELERTVATQEGSNTVSAYITEENKELRELLQASSSPHIVAGVIGRPPHTPYDTLVIDRGTEDGIVEHAPVYYGKGMGLGYIRKAFAHNALVTLFSSPNVESTVYVFGPNLFTTAYGEGGGVLRLSVPQGITIEKGNVVVLPSLDTGVLGIIDDIQSIPTEPEQHAYVTLDVPLQSIRLVRVGVSPISPISFEEAEKEVGEEERTLFMFAVPVGAQMKFDTTSSSATHTTSTSAISTTTP
jgi:cell shape-determining protein MreC